jgi:hypothetical protein
MELPPDYADDPGRWRSWTAPRDVHDWVAPELIGPVLDAAACRSKPKLSKQAKRKLKKRSKLTLRSTFTPAAGERR